MFLEFLVFFMSYQWYVDRYVKAIFYGIVFSTLHVSLLYSTRYHHDLKSVFSGRATPWIRTETHISVLYSSFEYLSHTFTTSDPHQSRIYLLEHHCWNIIAHLAFTFPLQEDDSLPWGTYSIFSLEGASSLPRGACLIFSLKGANSLSQILIPSLHSSKLIPFLEVFIPSLP